MSGYDGFYGDLSSRGSANEALEQVLQIKEDVIELRDETQLLESQAQDHANDALQYSQDAAASAANASAISANVSDLVDQANQASGAAQIAAAESQASALNSQASATDAAASEAQALYYAQQAAEGSADTLRQDLLEDDGSSNVAYKDSATNSVKRNLSSLFEEQTSVKTFGNSSTGGGVSDDTAAILAMQASVGYVRFTKGTYRIGTNISIDVPQYYEPGAVLFVDPTVTLIITNRILSTNQWIFQGTGPVQIRLVNGNGEDAEEILAGWFGVFPSNRADRDMTANLQRACSSLSTQTREGIVRLGIGSFRLTNTISVPRGVGIYGSGTRRTVFDILGGGFTVFETGGNACRFRDFQFEHPPGQGVVRTQPYIHVLHNTCEIDNLWLYPATVGILVDSTQCTINNIKTTYGMDPKSAGSDTSTIWVRAGAYSISNVSILSTSFSPHSVVRVGGNLGTVGNGIISNITTNGVCQAVHYDARECALARNNLLGVSASSSGAVLVDSLVKITAAAAFTVGQLSISNMTCSAIHESLLYVECQGTSSVSGVSLGNCSAQNSSGYGIRLIHNGTGAIRDIFVGNDVDVSGRTTRLQTVGTVTGLNIPSSLKGTGFGDPDIQNLVLNNDTAYVFGGVRSSIFSGNIIVGSASKTVGGIFSCRAAGNPAIDHVTPIAVQSNMEASNGDLTGTTGTVGKVTVGVRSSGKFVIENRSGGNLTLTLTLLTGV